MSLNYQELDFRSTVLGDLMLRRRRMSQFPGQDIYEIKLGDDFLMTSLFHEAEDQLAKLGLAAIVKSDLDVVVGGLGLGYTAVAALEDPRLRRLTVVDYLQPVIEWHQSGLLPMGKSLIEDSRCHLVHADFYARARETGIGFNDPSVGAGKHDVILLDIDHTPENVLHATNRHFYSEAGLRELATHLKPHGVFALWTDGLPHSIFTERLAKVFDSAQAYTIEFPNPVTAGLSQGAVYVAVKD